MRVHHSGAFGLILLSISGCVLGPFDLDEISTMQTRTFGGFSQTPSKTVRVRALNQATNQWITIGSGVSSASPTVPAGTWAGNPNLYEWTVNAALTTAADPTGSCFLNPQCTPRINNYGTSTVRLMFDEGTESSPSPLIVFDGRYDVCISERTSRGESFDTASYNCRAPNYPELRLRLVEDWSRLPARGPTGEPTMIRAEPGEVLVAASNGRAIQYSRKTQSSSWSGWYTIPGAPSGGFRTDTAPVALPGSQSKLFALGNDGNIYTSQYDLSTHGFGMMTLVPGFSGGASGPIDASWILNSPAYLVSARTGPNTVQLRIIDGNIVEDTFTFTGTELFLPTNADIYSYARYIAVRDGSTISVHYFNYGQPSALFLVGTINGGADIEDMTRVVGDSSGNSLAVARRTPFGYGEIVSFAFHRLAGEHPIWPFVVTERMVSSYVLGAQPVRLSGGGKSLVWRDAGIGLKTASLNGEGPGMFEVDTIGATGSLLGRPSGGYLDPSDLKATTGLTGTLVVSLANDQRYRVISTSSVLGRRVIESYVDTYSTSATAGCGSDPNVVDPTWLQDLAASYQPRLDSIAAVFRGYPRSTTRNVFQAVGDRNCRAGAGQPASAIRACELASYPVILSEATASYTCSDGFYAAAGSNFIDFERALARQLGRGFGFNNNGTPPAAWNSTASTIALSALQEGVALFSEGIGVTCTQRCPGFLSSAVPGVEEAFTEAMVEYRRYGFRHYARQDLNRTPCNDLLVRKYNWLKTYVYTGYEYGQVDDAVPSEPLPLCN